MSIWSSWRAIGHDRRGDEPDVGVVASYANGWSNHYPDPDIGPERAASLDVASIPVWCVPGHHDEDDGSVGPWLRLSVNSWAHEWASGGTNVTGPRSADVVLDETAARALRDDLTTWLDLPKAQPPVDTQKGADDE